MAREHDYFGILTVAGDGSLFWSETIDVADHAVTTDVTAPVADEVPDVALDLAAAMIQSMESLDDGARRAMLAEFDDRTSEVTEFILQQQAEHGDDLPQYLVDESGDIAVDLIRSLHLICATYLVDELGTGDPFAIFEYVLDLDSTNSGLLVNINDDGSVHSVISGD